MKRFLSLILLTTTIALTSSVFGSPDAIDSKPAIVNIEQTAIGTSQELIAWYNQLTEENKCALRYEMSDKVRLYCDDCHKYHCHTLSYPKNMKRLIAHAHQILAAHPHARIFSLGQSPAYILEAAKIKQALDGATTDTILTVAFSGNFLEAKVGENNLPTCYVPSHCTPSPAQLAAYRNYLTTLGLDPVTIVKEYENGTPTVIVEFTETGAGLASFILVIKNWATELNLNRDLEKALQTHILITKYTRTLIDTYGQTPLQFFPNYTLHQVNEEFMEDLGGSDDFNDRLVMHYSFEHWADEDAQTFKPSYNAQLIRFHILDQLVTNNGNSKKFNHKAKTPAVPVQPPALITPALAQQQTSIQQQKSIRTQAAEKSLIARIWDHFTIKNAALASTAYLAVCAAVYEVSLLNQHYHECA